MSNLMQVPPPSGNWVINVVALLAVAGLYFYVSQKGKNKATKEDISKITAQVESIKNSYAVFIENIKARHLLRMVALDKRLAVHQEAYSLLRKATQRRGKADFVQHIFDAQEWWSDNCLYLEPKAREAFFTATNQLMMNNELIQQATPKQDELIQKTWVGVETAFELIIQGVDLPPIKEELVFPDPQEDQ